MKQKGLNGSLAEKQFDSITQFRANGSDTDKEIFG
jgi:hypothetical protein